MMKLIAIQQYEENYGSHTWDGEGQCPQHWKSKGTQEEILGTYSYDEVIEMGSDGIKAVIDASPKLNEYNDYYSLTLIDWVLVDENPSDEMMEKANQYFEKYPYELKEHYSYIGLSYSLGITEFEAKTIVEKLV